MVKSRADVHNRMRLQRLGLIARQAFVRHNACVDRKDDRIAFRKARDALTLVSGGFRIGAGKCARVARAQATLLIRMCTSFALTLFQRSSPLPLSHDLDIILSLDGD